MCARNFMFCPWTPSPNGDFQPKIMYQTEGKFSHTLKFKGAIARLSPSCDDATKNLLRQPVWADIISRLQQRWLQVPGVHCVSHPQRHLSISQPVRGLQPLQRQQQCNQFLVLSWQDRRHVWIDGCRCRINQFLRSSSPRSLNNVLAFTANYHDFGTYNVRSTG